MFSLAHLFLMLNAIEFPEASSRVVEHYHSIRRGARLISALHLREAASRQEALRAWVGLTEASASLLARVGVVGPKRASYDSTAPNPSEWAAPIGRGIPGRAAAVVGHPERRGAWLTSS